MPEVTLSETYVCRGKILRAGTHNVSDKQYEALQEIGVVGKSDEDKSKAEGDGATVRLASGAIVNQTPPGVTPGDPVQRAAAVVDPFGPSAVSRATADPAADLPPPVVHTEEGEAVEPDEDTENDPEDDETDDDVKTETSDTAPPAVPPTPPTRPARQTRVTSRPVTQE